MLSHKHTHTQPRLIWFARTHYAKRKERERERESGSLYNHHRQGHHGPVTLNLMLLLYKCPHHHHHHYVPCHSFFLGSKPLIRARVKTAWKKRATATHGMRGQRDVQGIRVVCVCVLSCGVVVVQHTRQHMLSIVFCTNTHICLIVKEKGKKQQSKNTCSISLVSLVAMATGQLSYRDSNRKQRGRMLGSGEHKVHCVFQPRNEVIYCTLLHKVFFLFAGYWLTRFPICISRFDWRWLLRIYADWHIPIASVQLPQKNGTQYDIYVRGT